MGAENVAAGSVAKAGPVFLATGVCAAALVLWSYTGSQLFMATTLSRAAQGCLRATATRRDPGPDTAVSAKRGGDSRRHSMGSRELIALGLDYRPRPVIQSFSSFSPRLQALDRDHFKARTRPKLLSLRIEDIDGRLPTMATGPSLPVIGQWYDAVDNMAPLRLGPASKTIAPRRLARTAWRGGISHRPMGNRPAAGNRINLGARYARAHPSRALGHLFLSRAAAVYYRAHCLRQRTQVSFYPEHGEVEFAISPQPVSDGGIAAAGLLDSDRFPASLNALWRFAYPGAGPRAGRSASGMRASAQIVCSNRALRRRRPRR